MTHLLRVELPDVPGSLGAVASAIGSIGANIDALEIVEHRHDGTAVDDVLLNLSGGIMPDMVVSAVHRLDGVKVLWISRYAAGGSLHLDLEAIEVMTADASGAVSRLAEVVPQTFRSDWALVAELNDDKLEVSNATGGAPDLPEPARSWLPLRRAVRLDVPADWQNWESTLVAAAPVGSSSRMIVFGRQGGPEILDSELARLNHLATLAASIEAAAADT
jgi:hypothetical protein